MENAIEENFLPRIGAQFFINPDDTYEDTKKHFQLMNQYGIRMVRLFILWEHVEPKEACWDFSRYDAVYDLADEYNINIVSTLTCEDPPQWFEKKPFYHHYANLNDDRLKKYAARYIEKLVSRYHNHKAHYSWILMNEPEVMVNYEASTMKEFSKWLENKYETVENFNQKWYRQYNSFDEVKINEHDCSEYWQCFQAFIDWHNFLKDNLITQLKFIKSEVHKIDIVSPIHLNPKGFYGNLAPVGQDYWKEAEVADILGASIHPAWKFVWFQRDEYGIAFSFCVDIIRSASYGKSFWVTELQSGPTLMTGIQPYTPNEDELSSWVWDAIGAGAKSVVYWMWHPRTFGQEAGEWGIVTADHKVSKRLKASSEITNIIEKNVDLFKNAKPLKARVAVFYNHANEILSLIEGSPLYRMQEAPIQSLIGVYKALISNGIDVDFISAQQIRNNSLSDYEMLYLPYSYALDCDVQEIVKNFVNCGGKLWAEAPCGWKDSNGYIHRNKVLDSVFGIETLEYCGCSMGDDNTLPYLCQANINLNNATVIECFSDNTPAIVSNNYGKGTAVFVSSVASLAYFARKEQPFKEQIANFALEFKNNVIESFCTAHTNENFIQRVMLSGNNHIAILENWGISTDCKISLVFDKIASVTNLITGKVVEINNRSINLSFNKNETIVLLLSNKD